MLERSVRHMEVGASNDIEEGTAIPVPTIKLATETLNRTMSNFRD